MLKKFVRIFGGDPNQKKIDQYAELVEQINDLEPALERLSNQDLRAKTDEFRSRLAQDETLDDLLPEAYAVVREASKRTLGQRHYDVQMIGGIALHKGTIAEMRTGEGKTLVATLPIYLNALTGRGVHLITVNDYLARRDARWMAPIYNMLGLSVGVLQMAARTENGKKAFLVDLEKESPHEDQHQLVMVPRREAYQADITYGTNSEFGFDYLRDNMAMSLAARSQRGHYYAIIDEVDNVLIDEARTPLIISGPAHDDVEWYSRMAQVVRQLKPEDYEIDERDRTITLTEIGDTHVEEILGIPLRDPDRPEDLTMEQTRLLGYLEQALRAQFLFRRNKDYIVQGGKVIIIDENTGRMMPGRRWSDGLHQAVEAKENVKIQSESVTYATVTIQNYFRMYEKLAGMTGTALTEAEEFDEIYNLDVLAIPTNLEYRAERDDSGLNAIDARDEDGYKFRYYAEEDDPEKEPVFWQRKDYPDVVYRTEEAKLRSIVQEILHYHVLGRPLLVGTTSVELSERVSGRLSSRPLQRLAQILLLRDRWMQVNNRVEDGRAIEPLEFLNDPLDDLNESQMRSLARELDISFNPTKDENLDRLCAILSLPVSAKDRLASIINAGIQHQVLNARKHTEESQIIARAGDFGAVTIATNMAGRGVDIKLGGEVDEDHIGYVRNYLNEQGLAEAYDLSAPALLKPLIDVLLSGEDFHSDPEETPAETSQRARSYLFEKYGQDDGQGEWQQLSSILYKNLDVSLKASEELVVFWRHTEQEQLVRALGGLHVIGSERHEARRIDNQLRGRSARQGDPGSSRFYLSMEDELMRRFGGQQADALMQRLKIDDALPLEVGLVSRIVEQSQTRVEGANFDVRKHLLEYDDVLNAQRHKIYAQRNLIFEKDDLSEDVTEMLRTEINQRIPAALAEDGGEPWRLIAWLDAIQPSLSLGSLFSPSYSLKLLTESILPPGEKVIDREAALQSLLLVAENALASEEEHLVAAVEEMAFNIQDRYEEQLDERLETLDIFFEGLALADETDTRGPAELVEELSTLLRMSLRLSSRDQRNLLNEPEEMRAQIAELVEENLFHQSATQLVGAAQRRIDTLEIDTGAIETGDWDVLIETVLDAASAEFDSRRRRYLGEDGQITRDLERSLERMDGAVGSGQVMQLLLQMPEGRSTGFDKKTHRRVWQRTQRLIYTYYVAGFLEDRPVEEVTAEVLEHLENAQKIMRTAWGLAEWSRVANAQMQDLDEVTRRGLRSALGEERYKELSGASLRSLDTAVKQEVIDELGRRALTQIYRQLLVRVITDLWVDYLTQMEALRVSIGLEAYAQRDPLVQYKSRAYELFQTLVNNMRSEVVNRMFTFRPQALDRVQAVERPSSQDGGAEQVAVVGEEEEAAVAEAGPATAARSQSGDGKPAGKKKSGRKSLSNSQKRRRNRRS